MNYFKAVHANGAQKPKRRKAGRPDRIKAKHTMYDTLRMATNGRNAVLAGPDQGILRAPVQNTGMRLDGDFVMTRDPRTGMLVFMDENGHVVRKA